jgi:hypothetical protein
VSRTKLGPVVPSANETLLATRAFAELKCWLLVVNIIFGVILSTYPVIPRPSFEMFS